MPNVSVRRRVLGAAAVALATACSSHTGTASLTPPSPVPPTSAPPTTLMTPPPTTTAPARTPSASPFTARPMTTSAAPSGSPAARRTASARPSPTPSPSPRPSPKPAPTGKTYAISEAAPYRFSPGTLSLHRGDSVLVTNDDSTDHTFTIASLGKDSGNMTHGDTYRLTFGTTGTFDFVCTYHESLGMTGRVTVS